MTRLLVAFILLCVIGQALGGAALVHPKPWSFAESSTRPCGDGSYTSTVSAVWSVGSNQSVEWNVISGAGLGEVHGRIDPNGGTNFTYGIPIGFKQPKFNSTGRYMLNFIVPYVLCKGFNNTCTMQFWSDSGGGWYACTTLDIPCHGCSGGIPVSRDQCVTAQNLNFCSSKDGSQVFVPSGEDASQIDGLASSVYTRNHINPNIFSNGNSTECMTAYKQMMCELYLYPCGPSTSSYTRNQCQQALSTCGITAAQSTLYNCSVFAAPSTSTSTTSPSPSTTSTPTSSPATTTSPSTSTSSFTSTSTTSSSHAFTLSPSLWVASLLVVVLLLV